MKQRILIPTLIFIAFVLAIAAALASSPGLRLVQGAVSEVVADNKPETLVAGNYCNSCHLADDTRLATVKEWKGSINREENSPCPAAKKIHEELYYTDRLLMMIERAQSEAGALPATLQVRLDGYTQSYSRLLDMPIHSLDAFVSEAQTTRYQLNKIYTVLNEIIEARKMRTVLIYAAIATLVILGSLGWGMYNTRNIQAKWAVKSKATLWRGIFVLAILAFFALPIFRVPAVEVEMTTTEQQEAQTILDTAQRAADAADRAQARAWMLAQIGAAWGEMDAAQGQLLLEESLAALASAGGNAQALWGQSLVVQEVTVGTRIEMESAGLIAMDLNAARERAWAVPLVAVEWLNIDPAKAASLLKQAQTEMDDQQGLYRDLQFRSLALAWAQIEPPAAAPLANRIDDPAIRAWTLRELAVLTGEEGLFDQAAASAWEIKNQVQRAGALREIATASQQTELYAKALTALEGVTGVQLAYALSDLAAASGNASLVELIDTAHADARASALLRMGKYAEAWEEAARIVDPYEQAQAQAAIAAAWENPAAASEIAVAIYRERSLRDVIRKTGDPALVMSIAIPYYKVQALVATGDLEGATQLSSELGESYPLVALAMTLAESDPQAAQALVTAMRREADKAIALRAIAARSKEQSLFEQALGMALASRVRGDALAPAQASLELARTIWDINRPNAQVALQQAYEATQRIAVK